MNLNPKWHVSKNNVNRVHYKDYGSHFTIVKLIKELLPSIDKHIVVVCIGTDRSTGDALGPIVGTNLSELDIPNTSVLGTLEHPVHAVNLEETLADINNQFDSPFVIGIDACLGKYKSIGMIGVSDGPVLPGAGVNKKLLPVGDMNITGIVNVSGYMEYFVLQNTRLNLVMEMAKVISDSLYLAISQHAKHRYLTRVRIK
ncbi:spore protease YyaC [Terrilactibacillus laevilacticus]|uniref:Spore protease YyaC n=1 Tax=Terrilactibacillus laevilacticus TaxID=1380157 RepID=A0ABW5PNX4_9BACI|nr:spore protease YyaC [Terrilactibacillus laevilacticus]